MRSLREWSLSRLLNATRSNIGAKLNGTVPQCIGNMSSLKVFAVECTEEHCPLVFDDTIIGMWCNHSNDMTVLEFNDIDYRLSDMLCFVSLCSLTAFTYSL